MGICISLVNSTTQVWLGFYDMKVVELTINIYAVDDQL